MSDSKRDEALGTGLRYRIDPRDITPTKAARRLGLTLAEFNDQIKSLFARGFPGPDPTTGNYDLKAIELWQDARSGCVCPCPVEPKARDAQDVFAERIRRLHGQR